LAVLITPWHSKKFLKAHQVFLEICFSGKRSFERKAEKNISFEMNRIFPKFNKIDIISRWGNQGVLSISRIIGLSHFTK